MQPKASGRRMHQMDVEIRQAFGAPSRKDRDFTPDRGRECSADFGISKRSVSDTLLQDGAPGPALFLTQSRKECEVAKGEDFLTLTTQCWAG